MKEIKRFEDIIARVNAGEPVGKDETNYTMFWAYKIQKETGNELLDFPEIIWEYDIEPIAQILKEEGIEEFTISCAATSLMATLAGFDKLGIKTAGMTTVKARYLNWQTQTNDIIPAIRMRVR